MREWMEKNPQELEEQAQGRALWWDKPAPTAEEARIIAASKVPNKAYYYDAN